MIMAGLLPFWSISFLVLFLVPPSVPHAHTQPSILTAAMAFVEECAVGACEVVDQLVLSNEERALGGNGVMDSG